LSIFDPAFRSHIASKDYEVANAMGSKGASKDVVDHGVKSSLRRIDRILTDMYRHQRLEGAGAGAGPVDFDDTDDDEDDCKPGEAAVAAPSAERLFGEDGQITPVPQPSKAADARREVLELKQIVDVLVSEAAGHREAMAAVELTEQRHHQHAKEQQQSIASAQAQVSALQKEVEKAHAAHQRALDDVDNLQLKMLNLKAKAKGGGFHDSDDDAHENGAPHASTFAAAENMMSLDVDDLQHPGSAVNNASMASPLRGSTPALNTSSSAAIGSGGASQPPQLALLPTRYFEAPRPDAEGRMAMVVLGVQGMQALLEQHATDMATAVGVMNSCIAGELSRFPPGEAALVKRTDECTYVVAFRDVMEALGFALSLQLSLVDQCWPQQLEASADAGRVEDDEFQPIWAGLRVRCGVALGKVEVAGDPLMPAMAEFSGEALQEALILSRIACGGMIAISSPLADFVKDHCDELQHPKLTAHVTLTSAVASKDVYSLVPLPFAERVSDFQRVISHGASAPGAADLAEEEDEAADDEADGPGAARGGRVSELERMLGRVREVHSTFRPVPTAEGLIPSEKLHPDLGQAALRHAGLANPGKTSLLVVRVPESDALNDSQFDEDIRQIALQLLDAAVTEAAGRYGARVLRRPPAMTPSEDTPPPKGSSSKQVVAMAAAVAAAALEGNQSFGAVPNASFAPGAMAHGWVGGAGAASPKASSSPTAALAAASTLFVPRGAAANHWFVAVRGDVGDAVQLATELDNMVIDCDWPRELLRHQSFLEATWKGQIVQRGPRIACGVVRLQPNEAKPHYDVVTGNVRFVGESVLTASRMCEMANGGFVVALEDGMDSVLTSVPARPVAMGLSVPLSNVREHAQGQRRNLVVLAPRHRVGRLFVQQGMSPYSTWRSTDAYKRLRKDIEKQDAKWARRLSCISLTSEPRCSDGKYSFDDDTAPVPPSMPYGSEPTRTQEDFATVLAFTKHFARAAHRCPTEAVSAPRPTLLVEQAMRQLESLEGAAMAMMDASLGGTVIEMPAIGADLPALRGLVDAERRLAAAHARYEVEAELGGGGGHSTSMSQAPNRRRSSVRIKKSGSAGDVSAFDHGDPGTPSMSRRGSVVGATPTHHRAATMTAGTRSRRATTATTEHHASTERRRSTVVGGGHSESLRVTHSAAGSRRHSRNPSETPLNADLDLPAVGAGGSHSEVAALREENAELAAALKALHRDIVDIAASVRDHLKGPGPLGMGSQPARDATSPLAAISIDFGGSGTFPSFPADSPGTAGGFGGGGGGSGAATPRSTRAAAATLRLLLRRVEADARRSSVPMAAETPKSGVGPLGAPSRFSGDAGADTHSLAAIEALAQGVATVDESFEATPSSFPGSGAASGINTPVSAALAPLAGSRRIGRSRNSSITTHPHDVPDGAARPLPSWTTNTSQARRQPAPLARTTQRGAADAARFSALGHLVGALRPLLDGPQPAPDAIGRTPLSDSMRLTSHNSGGGTAPGSAAGVEGSPAGHAHVSFVIDKGAATPVDNSVATSSSASSEEEPVMDGAVAMIPLVGSLSNDLGDSNSTGTALPPVASM
jgi:hypothetical protein